jgi:hypothetical protein
MNGVCSALGDSLARFHPPLRQRTERPPPRTYSSPQMSGLRQELPSPPNHILTHFGTSSRGGLSKGSSEVPISGLRMGYWPYLTPSVLS